MTPFTLAGAMAPVTLAGALVAAERRGAGRDRPHPDRAARRAGRLRRVHLERRHAVGRARLRHARVHADGDGRRPARPALRLPVPLVATSRAANAARRPGGLRERVRAVGRGHGRRQPDDARRRLDGGRAPRRLREDGPRRRAAAAWSRRSSTRSSSTTADLALDAIARSGRAATSSVRQHTQARYRTAFYKPMISRLAQLRDVGGGRQPEAAGKANRIWKELLAAYEPPPMDPAIARSSKPSSPAARPRAASPTDY